MRPTKLLTPNVHLSLLMTGFGVESCLEMVEYEAGLTVDVDGGTDFLVSLTDRDTSSSFTTTWSYKTSTDQWTAGSASDVFLVPNLNAKFKDITEVQWNGPDQCATTKDKIKFVSIKMVDLIHENILEQALISI